MNKKNYLFFILFIYSRECCFGATWAGWTK